MKIHPVGAESFHADLRTYITKLIVAFCDFANELKRYESLGNLRQNILRCPYYLKALNRWALLHLSVRGSKVPVLNHSAS